MRMVGEVWHIQRKSVSLAEKISAFYELAVTEFFLIIKHKGLIFCLTWVIMKKMLDLHPASGVKTCGYVICFKILTSI